MLTVHWTPLISGLTACNIVVVLRLPVRTSLHETYFEWIFFSKLQPFKTNMITSYWDTLYKLRLKVDWKSVSVHVKIKEELFFFKSLSSYSLCGKMGTEYSTTSMGKSCEGMGWWHGPRLERSLRSRVRFPDRPDLNLCLRYRIREAGVLTWRLKYPPTWGEMTSIDIRTLTIGTWSSQLYCPFLV